MTDERMIHEGLPVHFSDPDSGVTIPAIVMRVKKNKALSLFIFYSEQQESIRHDVPYSEEPSRGHWTWPN